MTHALQSKTVAIAGAWGYIGRRLLDAALALEARVKVFDPGPPPADVDLTRIERFTNEADFYNVPADLFHLALHPTHRERALDRLLTRSAQEPILILNEKPMAAPEEPLECLRLRDRVAQSRAIMLFDFPELFHPMTQAIGEFVRLHERVVVEEVYEQRSKDREADTPRNRKLMVPIQHQETVHCLAFLLWFMAQTHGGLTESLAEGLTVKATARPYSPPNPAEYAYVVDGRCEYSIEWGPTTIRGLSDFKRGAPWAKRRIVRGTADGRPFEIDVNYLDTERGLRINGQERPDLAAADSYQAILRTAWGWLAEIDAETLRTGLYPNPNFTHLTYQLSSLLWRSSYGNEAVSVADERELLAFDAGFAAEIPRFAQYS